MKGNAKLKLLLGVLFGAALLGLIVYFAVGKKEEAEQLQSSGELEQLISRQQASSVKYSEYYEAGKRGEELQQGDFGFLFLPDGCVELSSYTGSDKDVVIPEDYDGIPVVRLGADLFRGSDVETVVVPSGLETIGERCFMDCKHLRAVKAEFSYLREIQDSAFDGCEALETIEPYYDITTVGKRSFAGTKSLKQAYFIENLVTIPEECFLGCGVEEMYLYSAYEVKSGAFAECPALTRVKIGAATQIIAEDAFRDSKGVVIVASEYTKAGIFAKEHGIPRQDK